MLPTIGLAFACVSATLVYSRVAFTTAKIVCMVPALLLAVHWHPWRKSSFVKPVVLYLACWLPSLLLTQSLALSLMGYPAVYSGSLVTLAMCVAGLLLAEQLDGAAADWVLQLLWWLGSLTAVVCLAQRCGVDPFGLGELPVRRAVGLIGSPVDAGAFFVLFLTYAPRYLWPVHIVGLWATATRGAWMGGLVAMTPRRWRAIPFTLALGLGLFVALSSTRESDLGRRAIWTVAAKHLSWRGTGPATFALTFQRYWNPNTDMTKYGLAEKLNAAHAHNAVLEAASTRGLLGLEGLAIVAWAAPELMGFWLTCLFNPLSFEIVFLACVLAGLKRNPRRLGGMV